MKRFFYPLIIIVISLAPFLIIFNSSNLPHTSDGGVHLPRMGAYFKAVADGHMPVRWAGDLNYGYGLPLFNFMYHTPYLVSTALIASGVPLILAFKITLALSFLLSGIFMYEFTREWLGDRKAALFITLFYQFAPFRLVEILVRGAIGGIYSYSFLPLVLWGVVKVAKNPSFFVMAVTAVATALLIISHNSLSLVFFGVIALFSVWFYRKTKTIVPIAVALVWGLALASFYWIPALGEHKYTYGDLFMTDLYKTHFPPLINFFLPNFTNMETLRTAEISVQLGLFHVVSIIAALLGLMRGVFGRSEKRIIWFGLLLVGVSLFFMQPISLFLWERISFLRQFQFPWRFLALASFGTAIVSLATFSLVRRKIYRAVILLLVIVTTAFYWYPPQGFDIVRESDFWNYPLNTTYFGETDVIWSAGPAKQFPKARVEFIEGTGNVKNFTKKTQLHTFTVESSGAAKLVDHTQYFPGWRVYVDGKKTPIEFQDQNWRGEITFAVTSGKHDVTVALEESPLRLASDMLSVLAGLLVLLGFASKYIHL